MINLEEGANGQIPPKAIANFLINPSTRIKQEITHFLSRLCWK